MTSERVALPATEVHTLRSEHVGDEFRIWIARPLPGFRPAPGPPHVLYVPDANLFFGTAVEMTRLMHRLYGELPPLLVVGIAYATDDFFVQGELRARDFTPTRGAGFEAMSATLPGGREPILPEDRRLGGADRFLAFLREELQPFVRERFEVAERGSTIFGSSLGGLFALYSFLTAPGSFDHYIVTSPSIWWDGEMLFNLEERLAERTDAIDARLFLAAGSLEEMESIPMLAQFKLVTNVRRMAERLEGRGYPSLDVHVQVLEGETHTSVVSVALTRGLRTVFRRARPESQGR